MRRGTRQDAWGGKRAREASARFATLSVVLWGLGPWSVAAPASASEAVGVPGGALWPFGLADVSALPSLNASILTDGYRIDTGVPFSFRAHASGGTPPYVYEWRDCLDHLYQGAAYSLVLGTPRSYSTTLYVLDSTGHTVSTSRSFEVVFPPSVALVTSASAIDAGVPFPLQLTVVGGAPPYALEWEVGGNSSINSARNVSAIVNVVSALVNQTGPVWATASVTDLLGAASTTSALVGVAQVPPSWKLVSTGIEAEVGRNFSGSADLVGGSPPLQWVVESVEDGTNQTIANGTAIAPGAVVWSWNPIASGVADVRLEARDAAGGLAFSNVTADVHPGLTAELATSNSTFQANRSSALVLVISGGWAPYTYSLGVGSSAMVSASVNDSGRVVISIAPAQPGWQNVSLVVADALGCRANAWLPLFVSPSPEPPSVGSNPPAGTVPSPSAASASATPPEWSLFLFVGAMAAAAAGLGLRWYRQKRHHEEPPQIDATTTIPWLQSLGQTSESLDREALYLLGEEEGFSVAQVDAAIDHWANAGQLLQTREVDGRETVTWRGANPPDSASPSGEGAA